MADDKFQFTVNVPVRVHITDVTVWPGKPWTDPKTGQTKKLPAQTSIQGTFDGKQAKCYLPGPAWKSIKAFMAAGLVPDGLDDSTTDPTDRTRVTVLEADATITLAKAAGDKHESWAVALSNRPAAPASARVPSPYVPPQGRSAGAHIPDMDGPPAHHRNVPPAPDPWEEQPYRAPEPALTPREEREAAGTFDPRPKEAEYLALYARVAEAVSHICEPLGIPVDAAAINAVSFSIFNQR